MKLFRSFINIPSLLTIFTLWETVYLLYWKFQLALVRYFDIDEYAYLWWASHMHQGLMPYRDFFFFATPGFLWFLSPIFAFFHGADPMYVSRMLMFGVFVGICVIAGVLFWEMRKSWLAFTVPLFLVFLPLPADKFLEIRPDSLSLLFVLLGLIFLVYVMNRGMDGAHVKESNRNLFFLGIASFSFTCSLVVLQKTLPIFGVSMVCFLGWSLMESHVKILSKWIFWQYILALLVGSGIVAVFTLFWFLFCVGDIKIIWYSLTRLAIETNVLGKIFFIAPAQFFFPNDVFYGSGGYHIGYILNLIFWCGSILIGTIRLFTPLVPHGKRGIWQELMVAGIFISSLILYKSFFPMKHSQYLMPSAIFVAWYAADGLFLLWGAMKQSNAGKIVYGFVWCLLLGFLIKGYWMVNGPKFWWRNDAALQTVQTTLATIPLSEPILDLEGITMYYPEVYYLSCLPIGQIVPFMSMKLPSLITQLNGTNTKFIYQGGSHRLTTLSLEDQQYIQEHFTLIGDGSLLVRNDQVSHYVTLLSK